MRKRDRHQTVKHKPSKPILATATLTALDVRTHILVKISSAIAGVAVVTALIGVWFLVVFPLPLMLAGKTILHGFDDNTANSVRLQWTAPGDDGTIGLARSYDIRYSTQPLDEATWAAATPIPEPPAPQLPGSAETFLVSGLSPKTTYYFALKATDDQGNQSAISNIATKTTNCFEAWSCTDWSACTNSLQSRTCTDLNACDTTVSKPEESRSCQVATTTTPPSCTEDWLCTDWSSCESGKQTRSCTDQNSCNTVEQKPGESRTCEILPPVGGGDIEGIQETYIVVAPNTGGPPLVKIFDKAGKLKWQFYAYSQTMTCGLNLAVGDLGSDGIDEIAVAPGKGCEPLVKIFSYQGYLINQFYAYEKKFRGGVTIALGNADNSGSSEVIVAPASSGGPNVRIFSYVNGQYVQRIANFLAYDAKFRGGTSLAIGDLDGNRTTEILTVPALAGGPHVRIFTYTNRRFRPSILGFLAYDAKFRGGVSIATGDFNRDKQKEIIVAPASRGTPLVRVLARESNGKISVVNNGFFAFNRSHRGGVSIAAGDVDYNGKDEIVTAVHSGDQALVRIFRNDGKKILYEWTAFPKEMQFGVNIATGKFTPPR